MKSLLFILLLPLLFASVFGTCNINYDWSSAPQMLAAPSVVLCKLQRPPDSAPQGGALSDLGEDDQPETPDQDQPPEEEPPKPKQKPKKPLPKPEEPKEDLPAEEEEQPEEPKTEPKPPKKPSPKKPYPKKPPPKKPDEQLPPPRQPQSSKPKPPKSPGQQQQQKPKQPPCVPPYCPQPEMPQEPEEPKQPVEPEAPQDPQQQDQPQEQPSCFGASCEPQSDEPQEPPQQAPQPKPKPKKRPQVPQPISPAPEEPEPEQIEQKPDDSYMPDFQPSNEIPAPAKPNSAQLKDMMAQSARKLKCGRFFDWMVNSGVLDELMEKFKNKNSTMFLPVDSASSKLPLNMLQTMNSEPKKQKKLMQLHTVPAPFQQLYPSRKPKSAYSPIAPIPTLSNNQLRFDRSLLKNPQGQYVPLVSGCPMLDSHQVGPMRMVSVGSVIFPPQPNVYSVIKRSPNLKLCKEMVDKAGMAPMMADPSQSLTMFPPSDQALRKRFSTRQLNNMVQDPNACKDFVNKHLVKDQTVYTNSIPLSQNEEADPNFKGRAVSVNSCSPNDPLRIRRTPQSLYVNDAHVGYSDMSCGNGVVHVMNDFV